MLGGIVIIPMALEDIKDTDTGTNTETVGKATLRLDGSIVADLKREVGVSAHKEVAPAVEAAIAEYLGQDPSEYEDAFTAQFEDEE